MSQTGKPSEPGLPADLRTFYRAGATFEALEVPDLSGHPSALERLGPSPFGKTGFPLVGFLATLYDQVATMLREPDRP